MKRRTIKRIAFALAVGALLAVTYWAYAALGPVWMLQSLPMCG